MAGLVVDQAARTIAGLVVPYVVPARTGGRTWRFARGSLTFPDRMPLLIDHNHGLQVGRMAYVQDTGAGPWALFRIAPGAAGDAALSLAAKAGFSPGLECIESEPDPDLQGCSLATAAVCVEVSLTDRPAWR